VAGGGVGFARDGWGARGDELVGAVAVEQAWGSGAGAGGGGVMVRWATREADKLQQIAGW
jgi:hypothetical protein